MPATIWTSNPTKLVANMDANGSILVFSRAANGDCILTVLVTFNVGADAGPQWTIEASRPRPTASSSTLLLHPQLVSFGPAGPVAFGKRKSSLIFNVSRYHALLEADDPGASNLAGVWGEGRIELDVRVNNGPPPRIHTLNVDLLNS